MGTLRLTTAQALVRFLDNQYVEIDGRRIKFVEGIFAVFGHGNVLGLGQALEEAPGSLVLRQGRNEQGMAHAAIGFAKQSMRRRICACTSSVGPGAANMLTAAATATANRIPLLLLPGDTYACRQPDPVLQQIEMYHDISISTNDAFRAVSRFWERVNRPEQLMRAMLEAMRVLTDPADTGAVTIALPQDVQGEAWEFPESFLAERVHRVERRPPAAEAVAEAKALLEASGRPLLICGGGVRYSGAEDAFRDFAEKFGIPFAETQAGRSALPWDHELNLGGIGTTGNLAANTIAAKADLVIGVGTRYTDFTTCSKRLFQDPRVRFLNINVAEFDSGKLDGARVTADAKLALRAISDASRGTRAAPRYRDEVLAARKAWDAERGRLFSISKPSGGLEPEIKGCPGLEEFAELTGSRLSQTRALGILEEALPESAIVVGASGSIPGDMQRLWRAKSRDSYHMEYGYSCMGYEVNAALGVKIAAPEREVYAFTGDGAYMMLHSELPASIQEGLKVNVVLFDNMSFACIGNLQRGFGMGSFGTEFRRRNPETGRLDGKFLPVDFAANAASYGCASYTARNEEELRAAIEDAKRQARSTLIDIKVLPGTMSGDYASWWRVGSPEAAKKESVREASDAMRAKLKSARPY